MRDLRRKDYPDKIFQTEIPDLSVWQSAVAAFAGDAVVANNPDVPLARSDPRMSWFLCRA